MLRRATALKRICDRQRVQNASRSSMYILRGYITSFSLSQGIRMRKIVERISLQMAIYEN